MHALTHRWTNSKYRMPPAPFFNGGVGIIIIATTAAAITITTITNKFMKLPILVCTEKLRNNDNKFL